MDILRIETEIQQRHSERRLSQISEQREAARRRTAKANLSDFEIKDYSAIGEVRMPSYPISETLLCSITYRFPAKYTNLYAYIYKWEGQVFCRRLVSIQ